MRLFIPRMQDIVGRTARAISGSCEKSFDPAHLDKALRENFLAIQRWANTQVTAVAIAHSTTHHMAPATDNPVPGPWRVLWDEYNLADTANNRLRAPESGVYFVSIQANANNLGPTTANLLQDFFVGMVGESTAVVPSIAGTADWGITYASTSAFTASGAPNLCFTLPVLITAPAYVHAQASSNSTACDYIVQSFSLIRVGSTPSKAQ